MLEKVSTTNGEKKLDFDICPQASAIAIMYLKKALAKKKEK